MQINATSKPEAKDYRDYKAENAQIERASQENNYIYSLLKKAQNGSCEAIKKLIGYSMINFNPDVEFAANLMEEAREMLNEANNIYTDGSGKLSDSSKKTVEHAVLKNTYGKMTEDEKQKEVNAIVDDMEGCITQRKSNS